MSTRRETLSGGQQLRGWAAALVLSVSGFELTARLASYSEPPPIVGYIVGFSCVVAAALAVAMFAPRKRPIELTALAMACGLWGYAAQATPDPRPGLPALSVLLSLLLLGSQLGAMIGRRIQDPAHLLFVALVSGVADSMSVLTPGGISKTISEEPAALALLALPWPLLGTAEVAPFLGVSDVVFASLYIQATRVHGLPVRRTLFALAFGFAATALLVVFTERTIPVLPVLGVSILAAQPRARDASAQDLRRGAWVLAALAGVIATIFFRRAP